MKITGCSRAALLAAVASVLPGCYYPPPAAMQQSYEFDRHPGVVMEVWRQYDYYGNGLVNTRLINRSNVDKCAWTDTQSSRLLRPGETWLVSQVQSPGNVSVANVVPTDPNCANVAR